MIGRAVSRAEALSIALRTLEQAESERVGRRMDEPDGGLFERNLARKYKYMRRILRMTERENEILIEHGLKMLREIEALRDELANGEGRGLDTLVPRMAEGVSLLHACDGTWRLIVESNGQLECVEGETPGRAFTRADTAGLKWREEEAADCGGAYERPSDT